MAASTTTKKSSISSSSASASANKDLSCLRCRKKKAKCSKTQPTCTRCARSNQPCEYPDAPPNLTDLSQKVLTLYDSLRELEGEFVEKYLQNNNDNSTEKLELKGNKDSTSTTDMAHVASTAIKFESSQDELLALSTQEPAGWSMSLTESGLSIHVVARNGYEWNEFAKALSRQLNRDFGPNHMPKDWDPDAEGYYEASGEADELEEDEYLVAVPICSAQSLLVPSTCQPTALPQADTNNKDKVANILQTHLPHMLQHLKERYEWLEGQPEEEYDAASPHLVTLMQQFKLYLPFSADNNYFSSATDNALLLIFTATAYIVSVKLLPSMPNMTYPPLSTAIWHDCIEYVKTLLIELAFDQGDQIASFPVILCIVLIIWIDHELVSKNYSSDRFKAVALIQIAIRLLLLSTCTEHEPWHLLIASFIYIDVYFTTFFSQPSQIQQPLLDVVWKSHSFSDTNMVFLEAESMLYLGKTIALFYHDYDGVKMHRIDVDDVLTLVRDIELHEYKIYNWLHRKPSTRFKNHLHLIHNMTKILLFRPFCTNTKEPEEEDFQQTLTKVIFMDLSISAADRLSTCLKQLDRQEFHDIWLNAAILLTIDVLKRAHLMFSGDTEILEQLRLIEKRLSINQIGVTLGQGFNWPMFN